MLEATLRPDERVLWAAQPDRSVWRRALVWGLGCLPFTIVLGLLLVATLALGAAAASRAASTGRVAVEVAAPATIGGLLLFVFLYPIVAAEITRRERRYVITTQRALVLDSRRIESDVELARVKLVALHKGLFDDSATGVELRVADGTAAVILKDLSDPEATRALVEGAIATARGA